MSCLACDAPAYKNNPWCKSHCEEFVAAWKASNPKFDGILASETMGFLA